MPKIKTEVEHDLGAEEARRRLDRLMDRIRADYSDMVSDLHGTWREEDTLAVAFKAYGFSIASDVLVRERSVIVDGSIPLAAVPFKGKIQQTIVGKLQEVLGRG